MIRNPIPIFGLGTDPVAAPVARAALRVGHALVSGLLATALLMATSAGSVRAQGLATAAAGFAEAWAAGEPDGLRAWFVDDVRLTVDGRTRTGVRPEQAAAALRSVMERFEGPAPVLVRAEPMSGAGESGFAELRWDARFRDGGVARPHTFLLTLVRTDERWHVTELRILD